MRKFFQLEKYATNVKREALAGLTTFMAMVYIVFVNPQILGATGMPVRAVFLATIFATVFGTLFMALFANVPYALAPGMGLNAFFTYTTCFTLGFSWQEALGMVFINGIINIVLSVTKVRKYLILAIPKNLQYAISGGIGLFIAYIGFRNAGMIDLSGAVPELSSFNNWAALTALIGIMATVVLVALKVPGAILIGIIFTTIVGIPFGVTKFDSLKQGWKFWEAFPELGNVSGQAFYGIGKMFSSLKALPLVLVAIFVLCLGDTFDSIGTFIGTGRKSGIFSEEELASLQTSKQKQLPENGEVVSETEAPKKRYLQSRLERAMVVDFVATSVGAVLGTSTVTTFVESSAGIEAGGKTGLTSVFTSLFFLLMIFLSPLVAIIPGCATAPALVVVGIMMATSFKEIEWSDFRVAVYSFMTAVVMVLTYNISNGIAFGIIFYILMQLTTFKKEEIKKIHPLLYVTAALFIVYYLIFALIKAGVIK